MIPAHVDSQLISASPVGTGPYKFSKAVSDNNNKIQEVVLARNDRYWSDKYYIKNIKFHVAIDEQPANKKFKLKNISAVAGLSVDKETVTNYSFPTSRHFGLIFNLSSEKFKDETLRKKIKSTETFDPRFAFPLTILDKPLYIAQAEKIKNELASHGIDLTIDKRNPIDFQSLVEKRQFDAILYGFDSGYDRDPYPFWHSSQINGGMNYSGYADKSADILLEDARMTVDLTVRNQKYDEFFAKLEGKAPVIFYPNQIFSLSIKDNIKGIVGIIGNEPWEHLNSLEGWYIKTKRIKP